LARNPTDAGNRHRRRVSALAGRSAPIAFIARNGGLAGLHIDSAQAPGTGCREGTLNEATAVSPGNLKTWMPVLAMPTISSALRGSGK